MLYVVKERSSLDDLALVLAEQPQSIEQLDWSRHDAAPLMFLTALVSSRSASPAARPDWS